MHEMQRPLLLGGSSTGHDVAGGGRFLKTLVCLHDDGGLVVVKVPFYVDSCFANVLLRLPSSLSIIHA